jgi:hypothetical protein
MIWFGSSAGVAISNMYPEAKSVARWVRHGWPVVVAYAFGFLVMLAALGWHPDMPHKKRVDLQSPLLTVNRRAKLTPHRHSILTPLSGGLWG